MSFVLILFDHDGCTSVVPSKMLDSTGTVKKAVKYRIKYRGQDHLVEALEVSGELSYQYYRGGSRILWQGFQIYKGVLNCLFFLKMKYFCLIVGFQPTPNPLWICRWLYYDSKIKTSLHGYLYLRFEIQADFSLWL